MHKAQLVLADGTAFEGRAFGDLRAVNNAAVGEVVFNTSMYGYQEILTDPSYAGQILSFTYPHIGNVGCNSDDNESARVYAQGVVVRSAAAVPSNYRSTESLDSYLQKAGTMGISDIDTRALVKHLRDKGSQMGAIALGEAGVRSELADRARAAGSMEGKDYVKFVSCKVPYVWTESPWLGSGYKKVTQEALAGRPHVVAIDCGIKHYILRLLVGAGFRVTVVPSTSTSADILALHPDGLFLSNGPGDPATLGYLVKTVRELLGRFPVFGICLGHQILGQVLGGRTFKLKFGHRGGNHPVKNLTTGQVEITVQNHGFAVDPKSLPPSVQLTHLNLNDGTVEGLQSPEHRAFSIQYHPEASPGPHDSRYLFQQFFEQVVGYRQRG
ncbi:MAG: glutamine-hydrolyzing carbamoyl-phosphate synthase small subunit [Bdellovibrionota bacterium]|nr:MAG: glutamine-hydrolyzing carbamoyl-phosphate synthase small subunit [Bdellovibrionota bacterium]